MVGVIERRTYADLGRPKAINASEGMKELVPRPPVTVIVRQSRSMSETATIELMKLIASLH